MTIKLIGSDDGTIDLNHAAEYYCLCKYTANASGTCSEVRVKASGSVNIKVAVYTDNSGEPGARLAKQDTPAACSVGWNTVTLEANCVIAVGTNYWIAFNSSATQIGCDNAGGNLRYKAAAFSAFTFPDPAGTGFTSGAFTTFIAGWGLVPVADTGSGSETAVLTAKEFIRTDNGAGADMGGIVTEKTSADAGVGSDTSGLIKALFSGETGSGRDRQKAVLQKTGTSVKLNSKRGPSGLPHKEVKL
jgi:hypothetical protein